MAVFFDTPEEGVARGQASVFSSAEDASRVLGGGFIAGTLSADERLVA